MRSEITKHLQVKILGTLIFGHIICVNYKEQPKLQSVSDKHFRNVKYKFVSTNEYENWRIQRHYFTCILVYQIGMHIK